MNVIPRAGCGCAAARVTQVFGGPSELNLPTVQFLPKRVFNSNHFFTILRMLFRVVINGRRNVTSRKIPNCQLVCFVLVEIQLDFPRQIKKFPSNLQFFPLIILFQNNLHATASLTDRPPGYTHAQHTHASTGPGHSCSLVWTCICFSLLRGARRSPCCVCLFVGSSS
jgi:hypothetical protein